MTFYVEITLLDTEEIAPYTLWSKLYTQLHLAFVEHKDAEEQVPYGVSFPQYRVGQKGDQSFVSLGGKLRVFAATEAELVALNLADWLQRLDDYVHVSRIKVVPSDKALIHLTVSRDRAKPFCAKRNAEYAQRSSISEDLARQRFEQTSRLKLLPFITLRSLTNGQEFSLKIDQKSADEARQGRFNCYGLSRVSTVPHW